MSEVSHVPAGRFEHKFFISDDLALAVREALRDQLELDAHTPAGSVRGYKVHSIYFDTPTLNLYQFTRAGLQERFKLRVRYYDQQPEGLAFVEVKEKRSGQTYKWRFQADKQFAAGVLGGQRSRQIDEALCNGGNHLALAEFCRRQDALRAAPKLIVTYEREAFNSRDEASVRITFDRRITANAFGRDSAWRVPPYGVNVGGLSVVLELKYSGELPAWLQEIVARFGLNRTSYSKFAECIDALGISGQALRDEANSGSKKSDDE
jgi:hypothetical protein